MVMIYLVCAVVVVVVVFVVVFAAGSESGHDEAVPASVASGYIGAVAAESDAFVRFLRGVEGSPRCWEVLSSMDVVGGGSLCGEGRSFEINTVLAVLVIGDLLDVYASLGHSAYNIHNAEGIGLGLLLYRLVRVDERFDPADLLNPGMADRFANAIENVLDMWPRSTIPGAEGKMRFCYVFGERFGESAIAQRYATHVYRWASLVAKADGRISKGESETLAKIMAIAGGGGRGAAGAGGGRNLPRGGSAKGLRKEAMARLDQLVGLETVKREVRELADFIDISRERQERGLAVAPLSCHCVFTGNPGTGKTTVARILASIYRDTGVVSKGHLVETDRSGLVAEYVGQTAVKTNKVIDSARGGVLFIDEAYALVGGGNGDYGREAIATLLKRMEDERGDLVVILAGYTDEMKAFIESNPGLRSRFNRYIDFPDYTAEELARIFLQMAEDSQYFCNDEVKQSICDIMKLAVAKKDRAFGNARYVRNLFEKAIQRQAVRLSSVAPLTSEMLAELTLSDLGFEYEE